MKLKFSYWTNRWGSSTMVYLTHTPDGWHLSATAHTGDCDRSGAPCLHSNFDQDSVCFPSGLGGFLEHAWEKIQASEWGEEMAQQRIQELADWVTVCEKNQPRWPGWN
jgi:hypothetical protein